MAGPGADHVLLATRAADTLRQTVGSADTLRHTVGSADTLRHTVGSADTLRHTVGPADILRQTAGSADTSRQTVGSADIPRQSAGLSFPSDPVAAFTAALAGSQRQTLGPAAPAPPCSGDLDARPLSGGSGPPLLVAVAAGWRAAGDQAASRALRLASPHSAREPLQEWVDPTTCVLLERTEDSSPSQRPGLTLTVAAGHPLAIVEVVVLSEFGRCEVFGDAGEYLATEEAQLEETVDDTSVFTLRHRCRLPVTELTLQCVSAAGRRQLWLYGLEAVLQPAAARPSQSEFSLPAVLARLEAQGAPLSEGAETLRVALAGAAGAAGGPPTVATLAAAFASGRRLPTETSTSRVQKLRCATARTDGELGGREETTAASSGLEAAMERCVTKMEERLWRRLGPRLESIERKQDLILDKLDRLGLKDDDGCERSRPR